MDNRSLILESIRMQEEVTQMSSTRKPRIRIIVVDRHTLVRAGFRKLIDSQSGMVVVGEASTESDALSIVEREQPDLVLVEPGLGNPLGLEVIPKLLSIAHNTRVILVTGIDDPQIHQLAVDMGAMGVILKNESAEIFVKALTKVYADEVWLEHSLVTNVIKRSYPNGVKKVDPQVIAIASLSERQREVITLVGQGLKNKQIAERLSVSETTVRHHLTGIFSKLGLSDRMELMVYAYRHGLATLPK